MEPANKPPVKGKEKTAVEFLPDADEMERSPLPPFARITLRVLLGAFITFGLWATFSDLDMVVIGKGRLVNQVPNVVVQPLETAVVQTINVRAGQVVKKGDVLATLDPTFTQADESQLRTRLRSIETQQAGLSAELTGGRGVPAATAPAGAATDADAQLQAQLSIERQANYRAQLTRMEEAVVRLKASIETNRRDADVLAQRLVSVREMEAMQEKLMAQNYGAKLQLLQAQDKRLEVEREVLLTQNKMTELRSELASAEAEKAAFVKNWRQKTMEEMLNASRERSDLAEQLQKAGRRQNLINLVAPQDGVVLEVAKLSPGSIARATEPFFTIVPVGTQMEAEVEIEAADVGYLKTGESVHMKLDAFPFQKHGGLDGKLRTLSRDAFRRDGPNGSSTYYLGRIAYGNAKLKNMKGELLPGMTVSAEMVVGKRSVISYLLWPLTKSVVESAREP